MSEVIEGNKYYTPKGKNGYYGKETGYKYGKFRKGMVKDNGEGLKKNGRKKGSRLKDEGTFGLEVGRIVNIMTFGVKKVKSEKNIEAGVKPRTSLTLEQACNEVGIPIYSFHYYMKQYPDVRDQYKDLRENRREYMKMASEQNIEKALTGKMKTLSEKDVVDYSFRMLEKTDQAYNPKQVVEQTVEEINTDRSADDIISDIASLLKK